MKLLDELQNIIEELVSLEEEYKLINVSVLKIFYINLSYAEETVQVNLVN